MTTPTLSAGSRQVPLRRTYLEDPAEAISVKRVASVSTPDSDPWHGTITAPDFPTTRWDYGIDAKVGGDDDRPNPGHLLCAALAACLESTTRIIADHLNVQLDDLTVELTGDVDVRGCLAIDRGVRTGFRRLDATIRIRPAAGTDRRRAQLVLDQAEALCVTLDTVRRGAPVGVQTVIDNPDSP